MGATHVHPRKGEIWLGRYADGAWAGLAASIVLAVSYVLGHVWQSYDSADVAMRATVRGVIGLGVGPVFALLSTRLRVDFLVPAGVIFALVIGLILGQTTARVAVPVVLYGFTLGLVLRHLRRGRVGSRHHPRPGGRL